jgi:hypothetical protein
MSISLNKKVIAALVVSVGLFFGLSIQAYAQLTTGCPTTCTSPQACYQLPGGAKRCMTAAQYRSATEGGEFNTGPTGGVYNEPGEGSNGGTLINPLRVNSLEGLLDLLLTAAIRIGTIILVLAFIWIGFLFVAARGNEEKLRNARQAFMWTVIGGLILLGARAISEVIQSTASAL